MGTPERGCRIEAQSAEIKLFTRWSFDDVVCNDISLEDYLAVKAQHATYLPHTAGRYSKVRFRKAQCPIVERLVCSMMYHGRNNGKKLKAIRIIEHAFEIIHLLTDLNPMQVLVDAIIKAGPREDSTRIGSAGTVRRQAVDVSPLRRVNQALYLLTVEHVRPRSVTSKPFLNALLMSLSMPRRDRPTHTPSRRRTSSSALPRLTAKVGQTLRRLGHVLIMPRPPGLIVPRPSQ